MDPFDNPRKGERPSEDPPAKQPSDSEPPIDEARRAKIEKLRQAVADGTYNVSAEEVADKLIALMLQPKE